MAQVIQNSDLDEDKKPAGGQQVTQAGGQAAQASAPGAGASTGGAQGPSQSTVTAYNPNAQRGSGYTNIQRIMQANVGNKLGQAVGGGIQQAGQQTRQQLGQAQQNFQQQSQQNQFGTETNQQLAQNVLNDPTKYVNQPGYTPEGQQGQRFSQLISGQYTGPQGLENAERLQAQAADVNQLGQAIGTQAGRTGLLQRFVGSPQYSAGQQRLDALLLGQASPQLSAAKRAALGLQAQVGTQVGAAQQQGQQLSSEAQGFGTNLQNLLGKNLTSFLSDLETKVGTAQTSRDELNSKIKEQLESGNLSQDLANQLGIKTGQETFNIDPNKFLTQSNVKATEQNIASAQDYARLAALKQLTGNFAPSAASDVFGKFTGQEGQAGQFAATPAFTVDKEGYQKAVQEARDTFKNTLDPVSSQLQTAQNILNWKMGQLTPEEKAEAQQVLMQPGYFQGGVDPKQYLNDPMALGQALISKRQPEAAQGGTRLDWAQANQQTAQQRYNDVLNQLRQSYGTKEYSIVPEDQQSALNDLENAPKVT